MYCCLHTMLCSTSALCFIIDTFVFFFFKQKTAYEMRISDWSSDVCSSDLFKTGLDQQFFGEGVADLNGWPLCFRILPEIGRRHGRAMDAVAPRLGADIDDRIADARCGRIEDLVGIGDAHRHRIDPDVAVIGGVEVHLASWEEGGVGNGGGSRG